MKKRFLLAMTGLMLLSGCAKKASLPHEYTEQLMPNNISTSKPSRMEGFSQSQVFLKDNSAYPVEDVSAGQALVFCYDGDKNPVVLCKNAYQGFEPGFLTRLYAAASIMETDDIYDKILVTSEIAKVDPEYPACQFQVDDTVRLRDLLYGATIFGTMDVMIPMAVYHSGSIANFNEALDSYMKSLGCEQSVFNNIYGTPSNGQYTNIYDLYLAMSHILESPDMLEMLSSQSYVCDYTRAEEAQNITMTNSLPYFNENGYQTGSGLFIYGGLCDRTSSNPKQMLVLAKTPDDKLYVAYVGGCNSFEDTKQQMEIILSKIPK